MPTITSNTVTATVSPPSLSLTVSPEVVSSGQNATFTATLNSPISGVSITFINTGTDETVGTATTNSSGQAQLTLSFTNNSSTDEQVPIQAYLTNMSSIKSNGVALTVSGSQEANNYGLACSRSGYYYCAAGYGSFSEAECNSVYSNDIGKSCR